MGGPCPALGPPDHWPVTSESSRRTAVQRAEPVLVFHTLGHPVLGFAEGAHTGAAWEAAQGTLGVRGGHCARRVRGREQRP